MPSRNIVRTDLDDSYYHVYSRGINRSAVLQDTEDKDYMLYLIERHLSPDIVVSSKGYVYPNFRGDVELISYCLMDNHFHLLFYQLNRGVISECMKSILTAFTAYYNKKHTRKGPLFESRFKASLVDNDVYLQHISRYIHLNPRNWRFYQYSSLLYILNRKEPKWLSTERLLADYDSRADYLDFVTEYANRARELSQIRYEIAL
jgi:putative transposase